MLLPMRGLSALEQLLLKNRLMRRFGQKTQIAIIIVITITLIFLVFMLFDQIKKQMILSSLENPKTINLIEFEQDEVLKEINELYPLGESQNAVIGKITDNSRLSSQYAFFAKAKNGNYLLVMPEFTLIYDRENKQIIDIARENLLDLKGEQ